MMGTLGFRLLADLVLLTHAVFVLSVVTAPLLVVAGRYLQWSWVRDPWFRSVHLAAIGFVVVQSWARAICPLTILENALRARAGDATYSGSFIAHWLGSMLYYQAPSWVFTLAYTVFGLLVIWSWFAVRPRSFGKR